MTFRAFLGLCPAITPSVEAALACKLLLYLHPLPSCCAGGNLVHNALLNTVGAGQGRFPSLDVTALTLRSPGLLCVFKVRVLIKRPPTWRATQPFPLCQGHGDSALVSGCSLGGRGRCLPRVVLTLWY